MFKGAKRESIRGSLSLLSFPFTLFLSAEHSN